MAPALERNAGMTLSVKRIAIGLAARVALLPLFLGTWLIACLFGLTPRRRWWRRNPPTTEGLTVAVVVRFYNANWCASHLAPIAQAENVRRVVAVVEGPTVPILGVEYFTPSPLARRVLGRLLARLLLLLRWSAGSVRIS